MDEADRLIDMFRDRAASPVASKLDALIKLERSSEPGVVPFLVHILADQRESEEVRIHVLKRLRNGRLSPEHRSIVAEANLHVLQNDASAAVRLHASMALGEFTDIDGVPAALGRLAFDWNESIDIRYSAFTSLQRTGPTTECIALLRQLSTDQLLGSSAQGVLSSWHLE